MAHKLAVIGSGYVGTVAAACFADAGHDVVAVEADAAKLAALAAGRAPFFEPGLDELLEANLASGSLRFSDDLAAAVRASQLVFICVGTPPGPDGRPDLSALEAVVPVLASELRDDHVVVTKSTVPVGTGHWLAGALREAGATVDVRVVSNPEFLREGRSVRDFLRPDRVVVGSDDAEARELVVDCYATIVAAPDGGTPAPIVRCDLTTAELAKYAANAFLATKISFANEIASICSRTGADVTVVADSIGLDARIGRAFLDAGIGWGGSCLGKDLAALLATAADVDYEAPLLKAAVRVNERQRELVLETLEGELGLLVDKRVAVLGLAFKAGTDDLRDSPALDLALRLIRAGAIVSAFDPMVKASEATGAIDIASNALHAAEGADALVVATDWPEFAALDITELAAAMSGRLVVDGRNVLDPGRCAAAGLRYFGVGRSAVPGGATPR